MATAINQMQMLYVPEEDRILFRVNSNDKKEFRLWLTRRFVLLLDQALKKHMDSDLDVSVQKVLAAKEAIKEFKQENAVRDTDFSKQFEDTPKDVPQGKDIPLAFKLSYNFQGENMQLNLDPKQGAGISIVINRQITATLVRLIKNATGQGDWGINRQGPELVQEIEKHVIN